MSGFIAIYNTDDRPVQPRLLSSLVDSLKHRGPDKQQIWVDGKIGLGHALFKTTYEAEYENQPATIDNKVWITCSARIDDRKNLVNKLGMKREIDLTKTPDSELILHAYRTWGEDCLEHLLGDFAFVIWDNRDKKLFCARDRFGMRQLYFTHTNNSFILCNSLNTIRQYPQVSKKLNDKAIAGFLLFGDHTWLDKSLTVYEKITSLLPAHKLIFSNGKVEIERYWDIPSDLPLLRYRNRSDYLEHFRDIFKTAIKDRLRNSSIAISMSGGMDSSSIAAMANGIIKENKNDKTKLQAVTSVYDRLFASSNERYYAGMVSKHLNIPIDYLPADDYPFFEQFSPATRPLEIYNPTYWLDFEKTVTSYSRVLLTGEAGDNLLSYSPAIHSLTETNPVKLLNDLFVLRKKYGKTPGLGLRTFVNKKILRQNSTFSAYPLPDWLNPEFKTDLNIASLWDEVHGRKQYKLHQRHPNAYNSLLNPEWNTDDKYMKTDYTPAERRDPFLDLRLVEFLFSLPSTPWFFQKHILRESMKAYLPHEITNRPKTYLGNMHTEIINEPSLKGIDNWEEAMELSSYISREKYPILHSSNLDENSLYVNLRVLLLNEWLKDYSN